MPGKHGPNDFLRESYGSNLPPAGRPGPREDLVTRPVPSAGPSTAEADPPEQAPIRPRPGVYISPNHPDRERLAAGPAKPPEDRGRRLATLRRGQGVELRISLNAYEGHDFFSVRVWENNWPVAGKGCTVRLNEAAEVADALLKGLDLVKA